MDTDEQELPNITKEFCSELKELLEQCKTSGEDISEMCKYWGKQREEIIEELEALAKPRKENEISLSTNVPLLGGMAAVALGLACGPSFMATAASLGLGGMMFIGVNQKVNKVKLEHNLYNLHKAEKCLDQDYVELCSFLEMMEEHEGLLQSVLAKLDSVSIGDNFDGYVTSSYHQVIRALELWVTSNYTAPLSKILFGLRKKCQTTLKGLQEHRFVLKQCKSPASQASVMRTKILQAFHTLSTISSWTNDLKYSALKLFSKKDSNCEQYSLDNFSSSDIGDLIDIDEDENPNLDGFVLVTKSAPQITDSGPQSQIKTVESPSVFNNDDAPINREYSTGNIDDYLKKWIRYQAMQLKYNLESTSKIQAYV